MESRAMRYHRTPAFSLERYVDQWFPDAPRSGADRVLVCPFTVPETGEVCQRPKLYVNVQRRVMHCFRCDAGRGLAGDAAVLAFLVAHLGVSEAEAGRIVEGGEYEAPAPTYDPARIRRLIGVSPQGGAYAQVTGRSNGDVNVLGVRDGARGFESNRSAAPALDYRLLPHDSVLGREAWAYLVDRGVTHEQVVTHRIGVAVRGRLAGRVVLPVLQGGVMVYYVARAMDGRKPPYLNPENGEMTCGASDVVVNLGVAALHGHVRLVEGYFDMLATAPTGCALLGKVLSPAQLDLLAAAKRTRPSLTASVMLDGDGTVSRTHALGMAGQLESVGFRRVPVEVPVGDPADRLGLASSSPYSFSAMIAARVGRG